jgi:predicted ferric reductase
MRLPKPTPFMVKPLRFALTGEYWTISEISVLGVFVAVQIATIITRVKNKFYNDWDPDWEPAKLWYEVTKTLGKTAAITILFLFIPVSKSSFWLDLFNMKFERAIKFHRWLAWFLVTVVVFHAATAVASLAFDGQFKNCMWPSENCIKPDADWGTYESLKTSRIITYGWLSFLTAIPLVITSLPWFRRHKFEWFYFTHFLFIPAMVLLHLHFYDMIYYAAPGLAAYTLDKVLWFCSSRRAIRMVSLSTPVRGFVRIEIAVEQGHTFEPGQWVQIKVPAVSALQWHPMSVASAPGHSTITIDVKVLGDWTQRLQDLALRFDPSKYTHTCVFMDRFHGSSHTQMQSYLSHPAVLMVAGGIGLTPMISSLRMLVEMGIPGVRRAVLVWVVPKETVVDLYREELTYFQSMGYTKFGCKVDVIVHATLSEKEDASDFVAVDVDTTSRTPKPSTVSHGKQWPFRRYLMGYEHLLVLTLGAGGGYLLGIFLANYFALDKQWRDEYVSLLQLCLAVLFAGILATIGMSRSFFRQGSVWTENDMHHGPLTQNESFGLSSMSRSTPSKNYSNHSSNGASRELNVVLGCRPDLKDIFHDMKEWCEANGSSSVGVSVCGPDMLIQSVMKTCRQTSSSSLPFVVDDETFEL